MNNSTTGLAQRVPESLELRRELRARLERFLAGSKLLPPLPLSRLRVLMGEFLTATGVDAAYGNWCMIFINNILWREVIRRIPVQKRLLLLPFCLRHATRCEASYDEFGLICADCGRCRIAELRERADALGLVTLVAESSSRVAEWVASGEIQAVIGVSCLASLERAFPSMLRNAVPGIAIPLNRDGCKDTDFDDELLSEALTLSEVEGWELPSYDEVKAQVEALFAAERVTRAMLFDHHRAQIFAQEARLVLSGHGKHYRPMLTIMTYLALAETTVVPPWLEQVALAVECFHKASLVHDDIEDNDDCRYGEPTVHVRQSVGVAINLGDYLQGEGYRLLSSDPVPEKLRGQFAAIAAVGHCELALGQAQELEWREGVQNMDMVLDTFRLKTAPAFRVALAMGALAAGRLEGLEDCFQKLSEAMGIAYQLQDDIDDQEDDPASAVFVYAHEKQVELADARRALQELVDTLREEAYAALENVSSQPLKSLLFRMISKILPPANLPALPIHGATSAQPQDNAP